MGGTDLKDSIDTRNVLFGNALTVSCKNITVDGKGEISCIKYDYWFAILTLLFIYLPSVNVIATLYGPLTVGRVSLKKWGPVMAIVGGILALIGYFVEVPAAAIMGWCFLTQSFGILCLGVINYFSGYYYGYPSLFHYILFIPLLILSPGIFICIKLLAIFKVDNKLLHSQSTYGSRGEAILEAAPQLGLQLYITDCLMQ